MWVQKPIALKYPLLLLLNPSRQNCFCKHVELGMISFDGGSNVVHDSPPGTIFCELVLENECTI